MHKHVPPMMMDEGWPTKDNFKYNTLLIACPLNSIRSFTRLLTHTRTRVRHCIW